MLKYPRLSHLSPVYPCDEKSLAEVLCVVLYSQQRRPQATNDYQDYDYGDYGDHDQTRQDGYPSYDDYEDDYPSSPVTSPSRKRHPEGYGDRPAAGFHGNGLRASTGDGSPDHEYDYGSSDDYEGDQIQRFNGGSQLKEEDVSGKPLRPVVPGSRAGVQKFTPGAIQSGFVPITQSPHRISKRSAIELAVSQEVAQHTPETANHVTSELPAAEPADSSHTSSSSGDVPSTDAAAASSAAAVSSDLTVTSSDPVTSSDLTSAASRQRLAYQPHYSDYGRQQGRQNVENEEDPYQRYLPKEDDNDPYFR